MSNPLNGTRPVFVKTVSVLTSIATMLSLSGAAYLAPLAANAAVPSDYGLTEGNTISASGTNDPDVYIVNERGYKRLFLNPAIFLFYGHLGGFANVKSVSAAARDAFPTSGLFRNCETNAQQVWAVEVTAEDTGVFHKVVMSGDQAVAEDANFFKKVFCINNNEQNWYTKSAVDYTSLSQVPVYSRVPGATPTPTYGPLSVSLASDNPAATTLISGAATTDGQAGADLAHFMFTGSGTVTSLTLNRLGVSADATLNNVYLYDGAKRLTDAATVSSGVISFNDAGGLFTVSGSKNISVKADILYGNSGQTVGVQLASWNGNAVSISGNLFTLATATLATVVVPISASISPAVNTALSPANDVVAWQATTTIGTRYVWMKSLQYRVIGSVAAGDLQNFRLFVDGVQKGSAIVQQDTNGYVTFDLTGAPVKLETGGRIIKVLVDVIGGSGKNFYLSLRQASDLSATDSQYGAGVLATSTYPVGNSTSNLQTIAAGALTFTKTNDSPSGDVIKDASGVVLTRWEVKASGERMKVENLRATATISTSSVDSLRNGAFFLDGVQIGSTKTLCDDTGSECTGALGYTEYSFGSSFIVTPGTPRTLELRADIYDTQNSASLATNATVIGNIITGSSNVQRLTSLDYVSCLAGATGCSALSAGVGNTLTVKTGSFAVGKYTGYAPQSIVTPKTGAKVGHWTLAGASTEDINVNTVNITKATCVNCLIASDLSDSYLKVLSDTGSLIYTSAIKSVLTEATSNSYSVNFTLPKSKTYQVEFWTNLGTGFASTDTMSFTLDADGITASSTTSVHASSATGQVMTGAAGALTQANGSLPAIRFVAGSTTVTGYQFTLQPTYDDYTLEEVYVDLSATTASSTNAVSTLQLKNSAGTVLASATVSSSTGSASFTGLNLPLLQSAGTKTFTVDIVTANVGVGGNDTAGIVTVRLDGAKFRNSAGTYNTTASTLPLSGLATTNGGNANNVVKGFPTFTNAALPTTVLNAGTVTLFKTVVSTTGGQIAWNDIKFTVASSSGVITIATSSYQLWENGANITDQMAGDGSLAANVSDSYVGTNDLIEFMFATERVISVGSPATLELRATVGGTLAAGNTITVQIANPNTTTVTTNDAVNQAKTNASFVWTDQSAASHNATTTDDWFTDGLVKALAESQTVTK